MQQQLGCYFSFKVNFSKRKIYIYHLRKLWKNMSQNRKNLVSISSVGGKKMKNDKWKIQTQSSEGCNLSNVT